MNKRNFGRLCAGLLALSAASISIQVAAQTKMVWKASDVHPLGYPTVEAIMGMGRKLEAQTNGRISVQMYPSMQLGGEKEMIEQAQVGALQIARISVGAMGPVVDELNVFNLPFIFRDEAHMRKVIDGPIGDELLEKINSNPASRIVALGWMDAGVRNVYGKKPVTKPANAKIHLRGDPKAFQRRHVVGILRRAQIIMSRFLLHCAMPLQAASGSGWNPLNVATPKIRLAPGVLPSCVAKWPVGSSM